MDVIEREQLSASDAQAHWYYTSKCDLVVKHIQSLNLGDEIKVADVGCGLGLFMTMLAERGVVRSENLLGIDPAYSEDTLSPGSAIRISPQFPEGSLFDVILMMDVLEHVDDDVGLVRQAVDHLHPGGHLLITVPALPVLWSAHDIFLGHKRRYTLPTLRSMLERSSAVTLVFDHYFFASILPMAIPIRLWRRILPGRSCSDMDKAPPAVNQALKIILRQEIQLAKRNKLAGLTAVAICKKN